MITILLFGSKDCENCKIAVKLLELYGISHSFIVVYVDALADETQLLCDFYDVDDLPHIVLLDSTGPNPTYVAVGLKELSDIANILDEERENEESGINNAFDGTCTFGDLLDSQSDNMMDEDNDDDRY